MGNNIQIPLELFLQLCKFHLAEIPDDEDAIRRGLEDKLDALAKRQLYSTYKDKSLSDQERERARQQYLDAVGIHSDFRW